MRLVKALSPSSIRTVHALSEILRGRPIASLARELKITRAALYLLVDRIEKKGVSALVDRRRRRSAIESLELKNRILELLIELRRPSAKRLSQALFEQDRTRLSPTQISRWLKSLGIRYRRTRFKPEKTSVYSDRLRELDRILDLS